MCWSTPGTCRWTAQTGRRTWRLPPPPMRVCPALSPTYEDGLQQVIRQAAAGGLADLSLQGLNRLRFDGGVQRLLPRGSWQLAGGQEVRGMEQLHPVALAAACDDAGQVIDQGGDALLLAHPCLPGAVGRAEHRLHAAQHAGNAGP